MQITNNNTKAYTLEMLSKMTFFAFYGIPMSLMVDFITMVFVKVNSHPSQEMAIQFTFFA